MPGDETNLPAAVQELIRESIHSIEELEIVLLMRRERGRGWSSAQLAGELKLSESAVQPALDSLLAGQFLAYDRATRVYDYAVNDADDPLVAALARAYDEARVETLVFIAKNAIHRVRKGALATFSEAFRLKGRKNDG